MNARLHRAAIAAAVALTGCSGGGGGDAGAEGPSVDSPTVAVPDQDPDANARALPLDDSTAVDAAHLAVMLVERALPAAELTLDLVNVRALLQPVTGLITVRCADGLQRDIRLTDSDGNGRLSQGDVVTVPGFECMGVEGSSSFRLTRFNPARPIFEAAVEFAFRQNDGTEIEGSFTLVSNQTETRDDLEQTISAIELSYDSPTFTARLVNGSLTRNQSPSAAGRGSPSYSYLLSGTVVNETLDGRFSFEMPEPFAGQYRNGPRDGTLIVTSGQVRARFTGSEDVVFRDQAADFAIDYDGSGEYQFAATIPWSHLTTGLLFGWNLNSAPKITQINVTPTSPTTEDELFATFTGADVDGDELTYFLSWLRNGVPLNIHTPNLRLSNYVKGDLIELEAVVSDGPELDRRMIPITIANAPPKDIIATLSPLLPRTADDLVLSWSGFDPDHDALSAQFEWRLNGAILEGQTSERLPNNLYRKGDLVTGIAHVSDGTVSVAQEVTVEIVDSPAVVSLSAQELSVTPGQHATTQGSLSDPDGDDLSARRFVLVAGPAGMTLDPRSGAVNWDVELPMFEEAVDVQFSVTTDEPGANVAIGTLHVSDLDREAPLMRTGLEYGAELSTGDFDGDGFNEVLVSNRAVYELGWDPSDATYRQSWAYLLGSDSPVGQPAAAADVDHDGLAEIFIRNGKEVWALDGKHRRKLNVAHPLIANDAATCFFLELADLDANGALELICGNSNGFLVFDAATLTPVREVLGPSTPMVVGNADADVAAEIVSSDGYVFDGSAVMVGAVDPQWLYGDRFGTDLAIGDIDGDGVNELVAADRHGAAAVYDVAAKTFLTSLGNSNTNALHVADIDEDGIAEIIIGQEDHSPHSNKILIYEAATSSSTPSLLYTADALSTTGDVAAITSGDFDADGRNEILWSGSGSGLVIAGFNPDLEVEWRSDDSTNPTSYGPYYGGALVSTSANAAEPLFLSHSNRASSFYGQLVAMNPENGKLTYTHTLDSLHEPSGIAVADYDGDGSVETFVAGRESAQVLDFWLNRVEWSTPEEPVSRSLALGDLNGDSAVEMIVLDNFGSVHAFDVIQGKKIWESVAHTGAWKVASADLDEDGLSEIVLVADDRLYVYDAFDSSFAQVASADFPNIIDFAIGDADGDARLEIYVATLGLSRLERRIHRLTERLEPRSSFDIGLVVWGIEVEETRSTNRNLVLVTGDQLVVVDSQSGGEVWRSPKIASPGDVQFFQLDGGEFRLAVGTQLGMILTR